MPIGLLALIALSVVVSRHARQMGRRRDVWVILLWLSCFVGGYLFTALACAVSVSRSGGILTETALRSSLHVPAIVGMVFGAVVVVFAVNRFPPGSRQDSEPPESEEDRN